MVHITVRHGLNIPIEGWPSTDTVTTCLPTSYSYDFRPFEDLHLKSTIQEGITVKKQQLLAEEKKEGGLLFTVPVNAKITAIIRGEKRKLLEIIFEPLSQGTNPDIVVTPAIPDAPDALLRQLNEAGLLAFLRVRPFDRPVNPLHPPRSIFVKLCETAPFVPSVEQQIAGREDELVAGLTLLSRIAPVHVVTSSTFLDGLLPKNLPITLHRFSGPHPASSPSLHIQKIDPIHSNRDVIWTATSLDVILLGAYCLRGDLWVERITAIAGTGFLDQRYVRTFPGTLVKAIACKTAPHVRLISGDPLTGVEIDVTTHLRPAHTVLCALKRPEERTFLHFLRPSSSAYSSTRTYFPSWKTLWPFTTSKHGEERAFIDGSVYENVLPFYVLPIQLVKSIIAEDFDRAIEYGFLEIIPEDFALADFICPSKVGMMKIIREGQKKYMARVIGLP